jgi:hypothetical protein
MHKLSERILFGVGSFGSDWRGQLKDISKLNIPKIALFLECMKLSERKKVYKELSNSKVKDIPLVHVRGDMKREELVFLKNNFKSSYFTIHENEFKFLPKWRGFQKNIFLEMNTDDYVSKSVKLERIGGFCVDISHFKVAEQKWSKEFEYTIKKSLKCFACNHLNGYSYKLNSDLHIIKSLKEFDYLETIPSFIFGKAIALETGNSIAEQIKFKKYIMNLLSDKK